jgi:enoyl-CoA hydratase
MPAPVTYALDAGVARIVMDDGKVNAMSLPMLQALHDAFDQAARDGAIVALSSSRPGVFSAGFDLKVFAANDPAQSLAMVKSGAELALKILAFKTPVLSVCAGHAYPMGAFLMLASDLRLGADGPWRIGLNEVAIGIAVPGFALELARQRLTPAYLSRTAVTGEMFLPAEAVGAGFLDRVVPPDALADEVAAALEALRRIHLPSHAIVKQRLRAGALQAMRDAIEAELTLEAYARRAAADAAVTFARAG